MQNSQEDHEYSEQFGRTRYEDLSHLLCEADNQTTDDGAGYRTHPAQHDDDERNVREG